MSAFAFSRLLDALADFLRERVSVHEFARPLALRLLDLRKTVLDFRLRKRRLGDGSADFGVGGIARIHIGRVSRRYACYNAITACRTSKYTPTRRNAVLPRFRAARELGAALDFVKAVRDALRFADAPPFAPPDIHPRHARSERKGRKRGREGVRKAARAVADSPPDRRSLQRDELRPRRALPADCVARRLPTLPPVAPRLLPRSRAREFPCGVRHQEDRVLGRREPAPSTAPV